MLAINEVTDVYCDALVCDDGNLVFASCWGRDTAIQELLARLTLTGSEGGISQLSFDGNVDESSSVKFESLSAKIGNPDRLDKMTGRMPQSNLFGDLVHVWLFDKKVRQPDYVNRRAYLLVLPGVDDHDEMAWGLIRQVCHLPLLEHWRQTIIDLMREWGWLKLVSGHGIDLISISIPEDEFNAEITDKVTSAKLLLNDIIGVK
ncbi:MAG: hypothetical protein ACKE51_00035 [Methylococcaceae bacterium]